MQQNMANLLLIIVIAICFKSFVTYQAMKLVAFSAADITNDLRITLIQSLMQARWQYYSTLPIGKSSNAIATEAESAGHFYTLAGKTLAAAIQTLMYTGIAFIVDWRISLAAIVFGFIAAFLFKFLIQMARNAGNDYTNALNNLLARLNESLSGAKALKAMGVEDRFTDLLHHDTKNITCARKRQAVSNLSLTAFQEPLLVTLIAIGLFVAYTYVNYPITELLLITFLFYRLIGYANQVQSAYQKTINFEAAVSSILQATNAAADQMEQTGGKLKPELKEKIEFKKATLAYGDNIVCENFSDHIKANKFNVIFGPSGIGKSTLLDAVLGMITPKKGQILIDEVPLSKINIKKWRHQIGYVPQETFLFHDSILNNITMGDKTISENAVKTALKKANAWDFIEKLEDGIEHIVGERGGKISGGQKQRIALARAIVRKPKVLILDEATTGLDKKSESAILEALQNMLSDMTIIAISHDPKILNLADHVIKLKKTP